MRKSISLRLCLFLAFYFLILNSAFAQLKEEVQEKTTQEARQLYKKAPTYKLSTTAGFFTGYDTNVKLTTIRKGDIFEEAMFSLDFMKPLGNGFNFTFDYDLDALNYNSITDVSNILNHFRMGPSKRFGKFNLGTGYDLGIYYYPKNEDATFIFQKAYLFLTQDLSKKTYHRIMVEAGYKDYTDGKAMGDSITTLQDKTRIDKRLDVEYKIASKVTSKLQLSSRTKFTINNSNARYLDFYDYKAYTQAIHLDYLLLKNTLVFTDFSYMRKLYTTRTVTNGDYKEVDGLYSGNIGLRQKINKKNLVTLYYTYRQNASNDLLERYSESVINCGWQYLF